MTVEVPDAGPAPAELDMTTTVTVTVPATSANLGPGYDCFGLALRRFDTVEAGLLPTGVAITVDGVGAEEVPRDETHLVVRAAARAFEAAGLELPGLELHCTNTIPHGGGQGSSAAAIVAGLLAGRALLPDPSALDDQAILELSTEMEGHPDNVAPALLGGFTLAWNSAGRTRAIRRDVHPDVRLVVFTASTSSSTHHSRGLLPAVVPHAAAAANAAAAALLVHALTVQPSLLLDATRDRLHQQYRAPSMPRSASLVADLRAAGVAAVISGAGPSVLALGANDFDWRGFARPGFEAAPVDVCPNGATVVVG